MKGTSARARSSAAGTSITARRQPSCTCGPARPTPSYSYMVSLHVVDELLEQRVAERLGGTGFAAARITG